MTKNMITKNIEIRNLDKNKVGMSNHLENLLKKFSNSIDDFKFKEAFDIMVEYTNWCWKFVKDKKISNDEWCGLKSLQTMFFGK